jgi:two-component system LytT family response regulator
VRTLVVDDEPLAREGIRLRLERERGFEVVGECANGVEAVEAIHDLAPDLVFLDVQMPGLNGFEVLEEVDPRQAPVVVFVTAYDEYALRAFEVHALDYVLKPFDDDRFAATLRRVRERVAERHAGRVGERLSGVLAELGLGSGGRAARVRRTRARRGPSPSGWWCATAPASPSCPWRSWTAWRPTATTCASSAESGST